MSMKVARLREEVRGLCRVCWLVNLCDETRSERMLAFRSV